MAIPDDLYKAVIESRQNGLPPVKQRSEIQESAQNKWESLKRCYGKNVTIGPWYNPITTKEETRILCQGRLVLMKSDAGTLVRFYR